MSDLRIQYDEEMVGSGHPTKSDTLNRLFLGGASPTLRDSDGKVLYNIFKKQTSAPSTAADEGALYAKENADGDLTPYWRRPSDGAEVELAAALEVIDQDEATLTGGAMSEVITLGTTIPDLTKALVICQQMGSTAPNTYGWAWQLTSTTQLTVYSTYAAHNLNARPILYSVLQVPSGRVERGSDTVTHAANNTTWIDEDIDLVNEVDLDSYIPYLNHAGRYLYCNSGGTGWMNGFPKPHSTDNQKFILRQQTPGGVTSAPVYWQAWRR